MAELIPPEYRLRTAQKQHLGRWLGAGLVVLLLAGSAFGLTVRWERQQETAHDELAAQYRDKSALITRSQELRAKRQELANRMQKIQELRDDKVLLSLLGSIADSFSEQDCLETVKIDAHGVKADGGPAGPDDSYAVHLSGITASSASLADLMTRLTKKHTPAINVVLENSHRDKLLDGQVMRFQILCEKPAASGT